MDAPPMHIAMFPWFAMGHITPFLHLSNKLAERGHKISFFVPKRTQAKLEQLNLYPHLITFVPISISHVDGLPHDAETTADVPSHLYPLIMTAMDQIEKDIEHLLIQVKPQIVFFDFAYWLPNLTRRLGIKSLLYVVISTIASSYFSSQARKCQTVNITELDLMEPPDGFPVSSIKLHAHEAKLVFTMLKKEFGSGVIFYDRLETSLTLSDAIGFRGCREIDGPYVDFLEERLGKQILLSGPIIPELPNAVLDKTWATWLGGFNEGSVVYCALGSEIKLLQDQFQQLLLGLEMTGLPFLAVLKPPIGFETIEVALPEGFIERVQARGIVHSGWIQQQLILEHPSIGCFITHCGSGSLTEALLNKCQMVLLPPLLGDQFINSRMMGTKSLNVGVEVEKGEEDGFFTKESVSKAVKIVMDDENELGRQVRANHTKIRNILLSHNFESACVDNFCHKLHDLVKSS